MRADREILPMPETAEDAKHVGWLLARLKADVHQQVLLLLDQTRRAGEAQTPPVSPSGWVLGELRADA